MENAMALMKAKKRATVSRLQSKSTSQKGGLNAKGRAKFKRETGANLKPPVTTKPSKLNPVARKPSVVNHSVQEWAV